MPVAWGDSVAELDAFDFELPDTAIARFPPAARDGGRLLVVGDGLWDSQIQRLPDFLKAGDLLVFNDVRVRKARLSAIRSSGGKVEVFLAGSLEEGLYSALLKPARRLKVGERLLCGSGFVELVERQSELVWKVQCWPDARTLEQEAGSIPLPPYLGREPVLEDQARYQTVFASERSGFAASAAPTAGLHFTEALLEQLIQKQVQQVRVALEVGLGTFQPLKEENLKSGLLHEEPFELSEPVWQALEQTRASGGRIVAVGTTSARVLEGAVGPGQGSTRLFIRPGYRFKKIDLLFTNFHLPRSSLLMLVSAFGGHSRVMAAYRHAVTAGYRFFSYGDAMLLFP
jgi:S-adenosylmethionine:tRNA ribosyltransferase-isomerase